MPGIDTIIEAIGAISTGLIPDQNAPARVQYLWRLRVGYVVCGLFFSVILMFLLAFGLVAWTGFEGFARASELTVLAKASDVDALRTQHDTELALAKKDRIATLDTRIIDLQVRHCQAKTTEGRQLYWSKIAPRMDEFTTLSGHPYPLPDCKDL